jgi:hypothetical protein
VALTPYSYRVRATDAAGNLSPYSNVSSATTLAIRGPVAVYPFAEGSGVTTADVSGGNNGVLVNSPAWISGKIGTALQFNGSNTYVATTAYASPLKQAFSQLTVSAWVFLTSYIAGTSGPTVISNTDYDGWALRINNGSLFADLRLTGGSVTRAIGTSTIPLNAWAHIALTYDGSTVTGYINGFPVGTVTGSGTVSNGANSETCTFIGNEPQGCIPQGGTLLPLPVALTKSASGTAPFPLRKYRPLPG